MSAVNAAVDAWRTFGSVDDTAESDLVKRRARFALLYALYAGVGYRGPTGLRYLTDHELYAETRQVANPVKALCDFYAVHVYSGPLSPTGEQEVEGEDAALPLVVLAPKQEKALRLAVGQLSQGWWGWDTNLSHRVRQTEILGSTLTEVVDDPLTGKITLSLVWPGAVTDITLDAAGNVKGYVLEYVVTDTGIRDRETGRLPGVSTWRYKKVVDASGFYHYRDDRLEKAVPNPYGFVPAVWDRAKLGWGSWGEPAVHGSQTAIDELNELWSHADDRLHQMFSAPVVVSGAGTFDAISFDKARRAAINTIATQQTGGVSTIDFSLGEVMGSIEKVFDAISLECPELRVYERIREMSQVTGPGIRRAVADVDHRLNERAALYDRQTIKLLQMGIAIAAWRATTGAWGELNDQQKKFLPFSIESFKAGELDMMMSPRALVKESLLEKTDRLLKVEGVTDPWFLAQMGVPEDEAKRIAGAAEARRAAMADAFGVANGQPVGPTGPTTATGPSGPTGPGAPR